MVDRMIGTKRMESIAADYTVRVGADECWEWRVLHPVTGYGKCSSVLPSGKKTWTAHRAMYGHLVSEVPDGLVLDHLCKNRACVNPKHMEVVTQRENLLRGDTFQARNAAKTECIHGHAFTPENTYLARDRTGVKRMCKACGSARSRAYHERKRAA